MFSLRLTELEKWACTRSVPNEMNVRAYACVNVGLCVRALERKITKDQQITHSYIQMVLFVTYCVLHRGTDARTLSDTKFELISM